MRRRPLANLLYRIGKLENLLISQRLNSINLRMTHARTLRYIQKHLDCVQEKVAEYLFYQPASFISVIKLLEEKQMVERHPDPKNGLKKQLFLLPISKDVFDRVNRAFEEVNQLVDMIDSDTLTKLEEISNNLEKQVQRRCNDE